jgi:membrane-associated phospholipid phosphatase
VLTAAWAITIALALQSPPQTSPPSSGAWPDDRPFTQLFQNLWKDLKAVPTVPSAKVAAGGTVASLAAHPADDNLATWAEEQGDASYVGIGNTIGSGWFEAGAAVATYAIGKGTKDARTTHVGSDLIRAQVLNGLLTTTLKVAVDRTRPNGSHYSFPSGHSSATFASAAVLQSHFGWKVGLPGYAVGGFVAWCRVRDRAHWLSDTVAGATLGMVVGQAVTTGHRARDWHVVPAKTTGGFALYVVRMR